MSHKTRGQGHLDDICQLVHNSMKSVYMCIRRPITSIPDFEFRPVLLIENVDALVFWSAITNTAEITRALFFVIHA